MSIMSIWSNMCSCYEVSLLIFCLDDLSIGDSGILRSPPITGLRSICALRSISVFFLNVVVCPSVCCVYV
jgi:hypothetical protein